MVASDVVKGTSSRYGEGIWNQKRAKYASSCSGCGKFIDVNTVCWITVGESPRCIECGRPAEVKPASNVDEVREALRKES